MQAYECIMLNNANIIFTYNNVVLSCM